MSSKLYPGSLNIKIVRMVHSDICNFNILVTIQFMHSLYPQTHISECILCRTTVRPSIMSRFYNFSLLLFSYWTQSDFRDLKDKNHLKFLFFLTTKNKFFVLFNINLCRKKLNYDTIHLSFHNISTNFKVGPGNPTKS